MAAGITAQAAVGKPIEQHTLARRLREQLSQCRHGTSIVRRRLVARLLDFCTVEVVMRHAILGWTLSVAVLIPTMGTAQVYVQPSAYPRVTAATAVWQARGEPIFHAGAYYYPTGPTIFFDGNVMMRTGTYQGVPLYED